MYDDPDLRVHLASLISELRVLRNEDIALLGAIDAMIYDRGYQAKHEEGNEHAWELIRHDRRWPLIVAIWNELTASSSPSAPSR